MEHRHAAIAIERLDHDLAMFGEERSHFGQVAGDHRRRHEARIVQHEQFFRRIADAGGVVDHQRLILHPLQQMGGGDVGQVERWVLPHQHDIDIAAKVDHLFRPISEMIAIHLLHMHRPRLGQHPAVAERQVMGEIMVEPVPARLPRQHDVESRIARDLDALHRVHLHRDGQGVEFGHALRFLLHPFVLSRD